jgi:hypothetical protein
MTWTERYLDAALRSIPEPKRVDVERELRSSIEDSVEERVTNGEERTAAERAVLEGLGDPMLLASAYSGKPNYLIGPELYPIFRHIIPRLMLIIAPIATIGMAALKVIAGSNYGDAIAAGISTGITTIINLGFWGTLFFVFLERADSARETREEITAAVGKWTVDRLPERSTKRVSVSDTISELVTVLITAGGLLFVRDFAIGTNVASPIPLLHPGQSDLWIPFLIAVLIGLAVVHASVYAVGRWTPRLFAVFAVLEIAFAAPIVVLALTQRLINPEFAAFVGFPNLADGNGVVMVSIAVFTTLITAWEIFDAYRKARAAHAAGGLAGANLSMSS